MKKKLLTAALLPLLLLGGCTGAGPAPDGIYENITPQEAKAIMDRESGYVILDVRTQEEYDEGHIPGAQLLPLDDIAARAEEALPDKGQMLLVYCRSGRRSKQAAEELAALGYTCICEFGGILDWPYEIEA